MTQSSCAGITRETANIGMSQDAEGPRHVTVEGEGFEDGRHQRKEQEKAQVQVSQVRQVWSGHEFQRSERVRSKQETLGRDEMRRHGESRCDCAGDWSSVVARKKSRNSEWNRIVCRGDCVRSFASEKLQVLFGCECSKGGRQTPRCVILAVVLTAGLCTFRVIHSGKSKVRLPSSRNHRRPEFRLDCACMERAAEDRESLMCRFSKGRTGQEVRGTQH